VLAINNTDDPIVPYKGGEIRSRISSKNLGEVMSVEESVGFWIKRDGCTLTPIVTEEPDTDPKDGTTVTRMDYMNGKDGTEVILYSIKGGGHTWPGGVQYLPVWIIGKTCRDLDSLRDIRDEFFLNKQGKPFIFIHKR
jgi:polyhydroxybutyrate depolymerase